MTGLVTLRMPSRCHCMSNGRRRWRGPTCAALAWPWHGAALASFSCTIRPSFPSTLVGSRFSPLSPYRTPLPFLLLGTIVCTPPCRANPIPSFLLFPTQARTGSAPWPTLSPPRDPLVLSLHTASTFGACTTTSVHQALRCHLACLSSIPPQIRSRAQSIDFLR
jgi:hypothetical protein